MLFVIVCMIIILSFLTKIKRTIRENQEKVFSNENITPFRIEDAQSNLSNPVISAPKGGILNENWCKKNRYDTNVNLSRKDIDSSYKIAVY